MTASGAAGSIASTATDLARWARALYGGEALTAESRFEMVADVARTARLHSSIPYGLGVQAVSIRGRLTLGHSGRFLGSRAVTRWLPKQQLAIAVVTNQSRNRSEPARRRPARDRAPDPDPGADLPGLPTRALTLGPGRRGPTRPRPRTSGCPERVPMGLPARGSEVADFAARRGSAHMSIRVNAYTSGGMASGILARPGRLRDALETNGCLPLDRANWQAIDDERTQAAGSIDDSE